MPMAWQVGCVILCSSTVHWLYLIISSPIPCRFYASLALTVLTQASSNPAIESGDNLLMARDAERTLRMAPFFCVSPSSLPSILGSLPRFLAKNGATNALFSQIFPSFPRSSSISSSLFIFSIFGMHTRITELRNFCKDAFCKQLGV